MTELRAAAVQLQSTTDTEQNLASAERHVRAAAADGAELVVLPERLDIRGEAADYGAGAEPLEGRPISWARELARELAIDLVAGSVAERREGHERVSNTSVHVGPDGEIRAVYRKIHMFDIEVDGVVYRESAAFRARGRDRHLGDRGRRRPRPDDLLRPALSRALPDPRPARRPRDHRAARTSHA